MTPSALPALAFFVSLTAFVFTGEAARAASSLAGQYDGSQMEVAAGLWLKPDGHFLYQLSYGALDEQASGRWTVSGDKVILDGDPVKAPRITLVSQMQGAPATLRINTDAKDPYDQQNFNALIKMASGPGEDVQLGVDGLTWPYPSAGTPTEVRLYFPVYDIVSDPVKLDAGSTLVFHFEPNDLGKADFRGTPLQVEGGVLVLKRFDRTLRFKRRG